MSIERAALYSLLFNLEIKNEGKDKLFYLRIFCSALTGGVIMLWDNDQHNHCSVSQEY